MHYIKFHIKTLKIAQTCSDPKIRLAKVILKMTLARNNVVP